MSCLTRSPALPCSDWSPPRAGRDAVLIDLDPAYVEMASDRIANDARLLNRGELSVVTPIATDGLARTGCQGTYGL